MPASCLAQTLTSSFTLLLCVRRASARVRPWRARLTDVLLHAACKQRPQPPSEEYPVAQSYVDVFIAGGFTLSDQFGKWCAEYTQLWGAPVAPATTSTVQAAGAGGAGGAGAGAGSSDDSTSDAGEQASQPCQLPTIYQKILFSENQIWITFPIPENQIHISKFIFLNQIFIIF